MRHKKYISLFIVFVLVAFIFSACKEEEKRPWEPDVAPLGRGDYSHSLFAECEFIRTSALRSIITDNGASLTESDGYIFKYAHDDSRYIAYHSMQPSSDSKGDYTRTLNGDVYGITNDKFCLYDYDEGKVLNFSSAVELSDYCLDNAISLGNWFYPGGGASWEGEQTKLTGTYSFEDTGKYRGQSILKNGVPVFSGYIDTPNKYGKYIVFNLRIAKTDFDIELIGETNSGLSLLSTEKLGSYRYGFLKFPIHYDKYIVLDSLTDVVNEFETEDEALDYVAENYE